jgi:hypothetical protein
MVKKNKYIFTLKVDAEKIDKKYDIKVVSNISLEDDYIPVNTTKLSELPIDKNSLDVISFLDETKKLHKCGVTMIDFNSNKEILPTDEYYCFWCKHKINTIPIGCPISYVTDTAIKKYYSEISKDNYTIKENITKNKVIDNEKIDVLKKKCYITDGFFCSWNCKIAFINDNKKNKLYDNSMMLSLKMYNDIFGSNIVNIIPAPHWRLLKVFGGNMTIEQFRNSFNKIEYEQHGVILPNFKSIGMLYEKKIKF